MIWKTVLIFAVMISARADRVGDASVDDRARPAASSGMYTSPVDPNQCQLGGRRYGCDFHPVKKRMKMHSGWDFQARPTGSPELRAVGEGKVVKAGRLSPTCGDGVQIKLKTGLYAYYCHMSKVEKLKAGDSVKGGQALGKMGQSGKCKGPHLHFVMASCPDIGEKCAVDPAKYLNPIDMCKEQLADRTQGKSC